MTKSPTSTGNPNWLATLLALLGTTIWILFWYWDTARAMVAIWARSDTYAHAFVVPPITLWLIWRKRNELADLLPEPTLWLTAPILVTTVYRCGTTRLRHSRLSGRLAIRNSIRLLVSRRSMQRYPLYHRLGNGRHLVRLSELRNASPTTDLHRDFFHRTGIRQLAACLYDRYDRSPVRQQTGGRR